jgi:hypothetical protein
MEITSSAISDLRHFVRRRDLLFAINGGVERSQFFRYGHSDLASRSILDLDLSILSLCLAQDPKPFSVSFQPPELHQSIKNWHDVLWQVELFCNSFFHSLSKGLSLILPETCDFRLHTLISTTVIILDELSICSYGPLLQQQLVHFTPRKHFSLNLICHRPLLCDRYVFEDIL